MDKAEQARKNRQRGKRGEKALAKLLDGNRIGIFGGEDISIKDKYSVESKTRQKYVSEAWMVQAEKNCKGKLPVVIVHITGKRHDEDLVLIRLKNAKEFFK